jgi:branched-chain amino acid transport system ATP-binding protein
VESAQTDNGFLNVEGLVKRFGAFTAVDGVDLEVRKGEVRAVIGPNGAGKTTFFNLLSGFLPTTAGRAYFNGKPITGLGSNQIVRLGIGRTFQITNLFPQLTVLENVQAGVQGKAGKPHPFKSIEKMRDTWERAGGVLELLGMSDRANVRITELSHGEQKLVDIGIALASDPELLLLDEPTAGLSARETHAMTDKIGDLSASRTIMIVEHDMKVVMSLAERISVLHQGKILAEGTPEEIRADPDVRRVYLTRGV